MLDREALDCGAISSRQNSIALYFLLDAKDRYYSDAGLRVVINYTSTPV